MTDDREIARWKHRAETAEARLAVYNSGGFADADALAAQFITLTAERDALAERADVLHRALRQLVNAASSQADTSDVYLDMFGLAMNEAVAALALAAPGAPTDDGRN